MLIFALALPAAAMTRRASPDLGPAAFLQQQFISFIELGFWIAMGVLVGQALELSGLLRLIAPLTRPFTRIGRLPDATGTPFLLAFQSGAAANSMLVGFRDEGRLANRELYASVLVVSALSLFPHLPTYIMPIGMMLGWEATGVMFATRFAAIGIEILAILLAARWLNQRPAAILTPPTEARIEPAPAWRFRWRALGTRDFWRAVWRQSRRTLKRLGFYLLPTFALVAALDYWQVFSRLATALPGLFHWPFLPPEAAVIIPAQSLSLLGGAAVAGACVLEGTITAKQAVVVIMLGSVITAPIRTLRHALPTYIATLGARPGVMLALAAQVLRSLFLLACLLPLAVFWL